MLVLVKALRIACVIRIGLFVFLRVRANMSPVQQSNFKKGEGLHAND